MLTCIGTSLHAQIDDSTNFTKHELGMNWGFRAGRITPGLQYYYGINSNQQIGLGLNMQYNRINSNIWMFSPEVSISYRWRWELYKGLNAFVEPLISYSFVSSTDIPLRHTIGAGLNAGMEYDFSKISKAPMVLGLSMKTMGYYSNQQLMYSITPQLSLRFKF